MLRAQEFREDLFLVEGSCGLSYDLPQFQLCSIQASMSLLGIFVEFIVS